MRRETEEASNTPNPFKVAIFFNSVMLFSPSEYIGHDITDHIRQQEEKYMGFLKGDDNWQLSLPTQRQSLSSPPCQSSEVTPASPDSSTASSSIVWRMPSWNSSATSLSQVSSVSSDSEETTPAIQMARKRSVALESVRLLKTPTVFGFPPQKFPHRISIPTLHVIGKYDEFAEHSHTLLELCRPDQAEVMMVDGGHDLPRSKGALDECARLFEMVSMISSLVC